MSLSPELSYQEAIAHLYSLEFTGMKLGLDNIRSLMARLGDPHRAFPTIHVAGTNGKGSVCNMLSAALQANGLKTGLFTSPHLVSYTERMRIGGVPIAEDRLRQYFIALWDDIQTIKATFFESTTAIAFEYFRDEHVDVAVIETGLGGRLDATNILEHPLATVITSIGLEHTEILGDTLEKIAYEKACIFKPSVPAIVNVPPQTHHVFSEKALEVGAPIFFVDTSVRSQLTTPLRGAHQQENLRTVEACLEHLPLTLDSELIARGIANTAKLSGLRARLEEYPYLPALQKGVRLFIDVAHNPHGFERIKEYFTEQGIKPIVVAGFAKDKDIKSSLEIIKSFASGFIAVSAQNARSMPVERLFEIARAQGLTPSKFGTTVDAVTDAISRSKPGDAILLTGSHYVVGAFLSQPATAVTM